MELCTILLSMHKKEKRMKDKKKERKMQKLKCKKKIKCIETEAECHFDSNLVFVSYNTASNKQLPTGQQAK